MLTKLALPFILITSAVIATPVIDLEERAANVQIFKNTRWTWRPFGLGACGKVNHDGDFVVALAPQQFGSGFPGPQCFKQVTLHYGGKSVNATVMDESPGNPDGGLDLTPGLFAFFANQNVGVISGDWELP